MVGHRLRATTVSRRLAHTMDSRGHLRRAILRKDTHRRGIHRLATTADNHHLVTMVEKGSHEHCHHHNMMGGHPHLALTLMLEHMHEVIRMPQQALLHRVVGHHQAVEETLVLVVRLVGRLVGRLLPHPTQHLIITAIAVVAGHHHRVHRRQPMTAEEMNEMAVSDDEAPRTHTTGKPMTLTGKVAMRAEGHHPVVHHPVLRLLLAQTHTIVRQRHLPVALGIRHHLLGPMHMEHRQRK